MPVRPVADLPPCCEETAVSTGGGRGFRLGRRLLSRNRFPHRGAFPPCAVFGSGRPRAGGLRRRRGRGGARRVHPSNFERLEHHADEERIAARLEHLRRWSGGQFQAKRHDFAARKKDGFVRECHGDMHLGNMVLWDGAVLIFDGIEFNEALRWIDVQSELAFLVMDLEDRGRADFARRALNRYLEITGDYAGLAATPYYLVYRALVRAKVGAIRLRQKGIESQERKRLHDELRGYLQLAARYTSTPPSKLIVTHGVSAAGKTTASERLVEALGAVRIRSDVERKRLFGLDPLARTGAGVNEGLYSPQASRRCYARLSELAETVVQSGFTVVVDAAFLKQAQRRMFAETAARSNVPFLILDFQADEESLRGRIARRHAAEADASEADLAVLDEQLQSREPLSDGERRAAIRVDTDETGWVRELEHAVRKWFTAQ